MQKPEGIVCGISKNGINNYTLMHCHSGFICDYYHNRSTKLWSVRCGDLFTAPSNPPYYKLYCRPLWELKGELPESNLPMDAFIELTAPSTSYAVNVGPIAYIRTDGEMDNHVALLKSCGYKFSFVDGTYVDVAPPAHCPHEEHKNEEFCYCSYRFVYRYYFSLFLRFPEMFKTTSCRPPIFHGLDHYVPKPLFNKFMEMISHLEARKLLPPEPFSRCLPTPTGSSD